MAPDANLVVVGGGIFSAGNVVRIVATGASKLAPAIRTSALQNALRLAEPVACPGNYEIFVLSGRTIEGHLEVRQRLSWHIRERSAIEADAGVRQFFIPCLQMALQTHLQLTVRSQAGRIYDGASHDFVPCSLWCL